jgi:subtilisin family serine protease
MSLVELECLTSHRAHSHFTPACPEFAQSSAITSGGLFSAGCASHIRSYHLTNQASAAMATGATRAQGVYYALPQTVVTVAVPIKQVPKKPGPYVRWAPSYFPHRNDDIITKDEATYEAGDAAITTRGIPDPAQVYLVKVKGGLFEDTTMKFDVAENGTLTKADATVTNKSGEFIVGLIQTGASIAAKSMGAAVLAKAATDANDNEGAGPAGCVNNAKSGTSDMRFYGALPPKERQYFCYLDPVQRQGFRSLSELGLGLLMTKFPETSLSTTNKADVNLLLAADADFRQIHELVTARSAARLAQLRGALLVCAAGNQGEQGDDALRFPGGYAKFLDNVIAVGAVVAPWSSRGPGLTVAAPGVNVLSTMPNYAVTHPNGGSAYGFLDGTSMATPMVTGLAALIWSQRPGLSAALLKRHIRRTATPLGASSDFGAGLINMKKALQDL